MSFRPLSHPKKTAVRILESRRIDQFIATALMQDAILAKLPVSVGRVIHYILLFEVGNLFTQNLQ